MYLFLQQGLTVRHHAQPGYMLAFVIHKPSFEAKLVRARLAYPALPLVTEIASLLQAALCSALGTATGWGYLQLLARDVEQYTAESDLPLNTAQQIAVQPLRGLAIGIAAYRQADLHPTPKCCIWHVWQPCFSKAARHKLPMDSVSLAWH